ncbi:MAG: glycosyltransferase [Planctomycetia bacterium]|nr:glycosyltransferase [Planctomycetia bacterium]
MTTQSLRTEPLVGRLVRDVPSPPTDLARPPAQSPRRRWRQYLKWCLGIRLGSFEHYPPRPLRVPTRYWRKSVLSQPPLISIVTPTINQGAFLERTLRSVLEQGYPRLEYIVQDGASGDETPAILDRFKTRLHHVDSRPDGGQAHALNLGFAHARGEIMAYLNSDDLLLPGALHYVAAYFSAHPQVDVVYGHRVIVDRDDGEIGRWVLPPHSNAMLSWADYVPQETLFWRRRIWDRAGGRMDERFQFALDWDLLLRFRAAGARLVRLPRFLGAFRVHDAQKTSALLESVGAREMNALRRRALGREVSKVEVRSANLPYLLRHALYHWLYQTGLAGY